MGLLVADHLQPVLQRPVRGVISGERVPRLCINPPGLRKRGKTVNRPPCPQRRVAPAKGKLLRLHEELDLANPAGAELHIVAGQVVSPRQSLGVADLGADVVDVLQRGEIQMPPPDEGLQPVEKRRARLHIPGAGSRLDERRPLPCPPEAFIIPLRGVHRHAKRGDRRIGAKPQIGAKDIALRRLLGQQLDDPLRHLGPARLRLHRHVGAKAFVVVEKNKVDIGGIVQLPRPALAHGEGDQAGLLGAQPFQRPARLPLQRIGEGEGHRTVGEVGQRAGHFVQRPDPAEIGQSDQQRRAPFHPAKGGADLPRALHRVDRVQDRRETLVRRTAKRIRQPVSLFLDQPRQIRAGSRRSPDQVGDRPGGANALNRFRPPARVMGAGRGGDGGGKRDHRPS